MSAPVATQAYFQTPGHVVAAGVVLGLVDIVGMILRFMARKRQKQLIKADDWFMVAATVSTYLNLP